MNQQEAIRSLEAIDREYVLLSHISGVLVWDQEQVPPAGAEERATQLGLLDRKMYELTASDTVGEILDALGASDVAEAGDPSLDERTGALVRHYWENWNRQRKLDADFVQQFSELTGRAHQIWAQARQDDDFSLYEPTLSEIIELVRQKAQRFGYTDDPYDPLLNVFEPGTTTAEVSQVFSAMQKDILEVLEYVREEHAAIDDSFLSQSFPQDKQAAFAHDILDAMGYDWNRGVSGIATHPYSISLGSDDIRITTRYTEPQVTSPLFSSIHEAGHALYEMGASNARTRGTSLANGASLAFHESQSRLWENMVGRSKAFWSRFYPRLQHLFPLQLDKVDTEQFYRAVNRVKPSCIRVDADEVTYGLHIILRFNLERQLLTGQLEVSDLPDAWNTAMEVLLGIRPESDRTGVLQDIHWSMGELGYFPTYALGNLYGAQILDTMQQDLPVDEVIGSGDFSPIRQWLTDHILQHGAIYRPKDLLIKVSGHALDARHFRDYLQRKYMGEN
jgi:carboxypeptidase Taq